MGRVPPCRPAGVPARTRTGRSATQPDPRSCSDAADPDISGSGDNADSRARRTAQATRTAEIYEELRASGENLVVVLGDFNDTPDSPPLRPLLANTDLRDVSEHPSLTPASSAPKQHTG